jgi:hypothetical protein
MSFRRFLLSVLMNTGPVSAGCYLSSADSVWASNLLKMASRRNRSGVQPNTLRQSTEGHRGKSLSRGSNYSYELLYLLNLGCDSQLSRLVP